MSVQEIIKLINKDEITELNQVNEKFILNDEILEAYFKKNLNHNDLKKKLKTDSHFKNYKPEDDVLYHSLLSLFKSFVLEDVNDNKFKIRSIKEYIDSFEELHQEEKNNKFSLTFKNLTILDRICRYHTFLELEQLNFKESKDQIIERYNGYAEMYPPGSMRGEWLGSEKIYYQDLSDDLQHDLKICEYAVWDDENNYQFFPNDIKYSPKILNHLIQEGYLTNEIVDEYSEIDKTPVQSPEDYSKKYNSLPWKYAKDYPTIINVKKNFKVDFNSFDNVKYLENSIDSIQYLFWLNNTIFPYEYVFLYFLDIPKGLYSLITFNHFHKIGYCNLKDINKFNFEKILKKKLEKASRQNDQLESMGNRTIVDIEWYIKPSYDTKKGCLFFTEKIKWSDGYNNYSSSIFIFSKQGYLQVGVNFEEKNIDSLNEDFLNTIVDRVIFEDGYKYSDFTSRDKKSDYSIEDIIIKS